MGYQISYDPEVLAQIKAHLQSAFPEEGCGFLLGKDGAPRHIDHFIPAENVYEGERFRRFSIRPEDYLAAEAFAAENGLDLLGIYHSHPNHPAVPSGTDLENAVPWFSYLIVTTTAAGAGEGRTWQIGEEGVFVEQNSQNSLNSQNALGSRDALGSRNEVGARDALGSLEAVVGSGLGE